MTDTTPSSGHNRLRSIDPEKILLVDPEEIAPLLTLNFQELAERNAELARHAENWIVDHTDPKTGLQTVLDDADNNLLSDLYRQIKDHAGADGEVDTARKRIKLQPFRAIQAIDAHFNNLRTDLVLWMDKITKLQKDFLTRKLARERREREEAAERARAEAERLVAQARKKQTEESVDKAIEAETIATMAEEATDLSVADMTRSRSALGGVTSASAIFSFEIENMQELCAAIGRGEVPSTFVTPNDSAIRLAIRGKHGIRKCPGLRIFEDIRLSRRGG
jgi:hypothetical protein